MEITERTRTRLRRFRGRYRAICERSGLEYSWLTKFSCGERGRRPSYEAMKRLTTALDAIEADDAAARRKPSVRVRRKSVHAQKGGQ